jgi:hypothetical protein
VTKRDRKALADYVRLVADEMGLRDWEIRLAEHPAEPGKCASVEIVYGRKFATLEVPDTFKSEQTPEDQRDSVVHELVHCHLESMANMVQNDLESLLGRPADSLFFAGFTRQYEYGVDGLAGALAKHLPLPAWPD